MGDEDSEQQKEELESLLSIYGDEITVLEAEREYLVNIPVTVDGKLELVVESTGSAHDGAHSSARPKWRVTHLPNLTLYVRYPVNYPSQSCPVYHLSARWLNPTHTATLGEKFEALFTPGWPVVFEWINYLSNELAEDYCKLQQATPPATTNMATSSTCTASEGNELVNTGSPSKLFIRSISQGEDIVAHDEYQKHQSFLQDYHECGICCERKQGTLFGDPCSSCEEGEVFCRDCLAHYCQTLIQEGLYANMKCPSSSCSAVLKDTQIESLVPSIVYQRYLHLRSELELDCIPGMIYCPRPGCGARTSSDPSSNLAVCQHCSFPFCKLCKQTWHGIQRCPTLEKLEKAESAQAEDNEGTGKQADHDQHQQRKIEEMKSAVWLRTHDSVKLCPKCSYTIQKNGGCNKMTCWKCNTSFCWLCGQQVVGYAHFDERMCPLFRTEDYLPPKAEEEVDLPDQEQQLENLIISKCPRCAQPEHKVDNRNWMRCGKCRFPFCHLCKEACFGRYHFSEYGCREFTTLDEDMKILQIEPGVEKGGKEDQ